MKNYELVPCYLTICECLTQKGTYTCLVLASALFVYDLCIFCPVYVSVDVGLMNVYRVIRACRFEFALTVLQQFDVFSLDTTV
jgi:hypothetical protein